MSKISKATAFVLELTEDETQGLHALLWRGTSLNAIHELGIGELNNQLAVIFGVAEDAWAKAPRSDVRFNAIAAVE